MKSLLVLTAIIFLLVFIILKLLFEIYILTKKIKYVDEANMWHKLAVTDDLTGIYNRNAYNLHISENRIGKGKETKGIILFDIDNFKIINDTKGHRAGDVVLKNVAGILLEVFTEPVYKVFRMGGDEFSVLSEGVSENEIIEQLILLKKRLDADGDISLSKGYAIIRDNYEDAYKYADEMLYADKLAKNLRSSCTKSK